MNRLPHIAALFAAVLLVAADNPFKQSKSAPKPVPSAAQIEKWIKQLGDDNFRVREEATRLLIMAGEPVIPAVQKVITSNDAEVRARARRILIKITNSPEKVVHEFLEAIRTANDKKAELLLTKKAREKHKEIGLRVKPAGSPTAQFKIGKVDYVDQGARVLSMWTDIDSNGKERTDRFIWLLRKEPEGWRIAGMAVEIFNGKPPLVLNFEDPKEMEIKQRLAKEEIIRRQAQNVRRAERPQKTGKKILR